MAARLAGAGAIVSVRMRLRLIGAKARLSYTDIVDCNLVNFIDLFAGLGGIRKGFDAIGEHCVFTSKWNKYAQQTYVANFRDYHRRRR